MDFFFRPQGIAVIGATPNRQKGGNSILRNLILGYKGDIFPVNPNYNEIEGFACYASVNKIDKPVDLAIIFVPAGQVPAAVQECASKGVKGVIIESSGFAETGTEGRKLQDDLVRIGKETGIRIWGPNCMGLVDAVNRHVFSFMDTANLEEGLIPGKVSLIVQSGMLSAAFLVDIMSHGIMGISKVCSIGNKLDVNECDLLPALLDDPDTAAIGMYLESISDARRFAEICRNSTKPLVVLKSGKSRIGAEAAMSHTASMASNHRVVEGVLAQTGVHEAKDFKQMMDLCRSLAMYPSKPAGNKRIAVLTFSGGAGIVSADFFEEYGLSVAELSPVCKEELQKLYPSWMPVANPVDIWPAIERHLGSGVDVYGSSLRSLFKDPGVDGALILVMAGSSRIGMNMKDIAEKSHSAGKPVFIWLLGRRDASFSVFEEARQYEIPVFQELSRAVECMAAVFKEKPATPKEKPTTPEHSIMWIDQALPGALDEHTAKELLSSCGIPVVEEISTENLNACIEAAEKLGYPVVVKGLMPGITHKTESGLVRLNIDNRDATARAYDMLMLAMEGKGTVSVQKQLSKSVEIIVGMFRDRQFGACVMVGLGGVMAEALQDVAFAMAPVTHEEALQLISRIKGQRLLDGFRGIPPVIRKELADTIVTVSALGASNNRISEIDINPLMATENGLVAVDAVVVID
jgi:acyl-CoA synthetase (NDP forming)